MKIVNPYQVYSYEQMMQDLDYLCTQYPELFHQWVIGTSVEGREIPAFQMGTGKKQILMIGAQHAREYIGTAFLMDLADRHGHGYTYHMVSGHYDFRLLLEQVTFIFVPMMNPDGVCLVQRGIASVFQPELIKTLPIIEKGYGYRSWKANIRGVDLNRNFPFRWVPRGIRSSEGYAGPHAGSEPETLAVKKLIDETDFELLASFHAQGEMIFWAEDITGGKLALIHEPLVDRIAKETGYQKMPILKQDGKSGYMTDYVRHSKEKPAFTIELCKSIGPYPYPEQYFDQVAEPVKNIAFILADLISKD